MQVKYVCGCKQVSLITGMLSNRYCWSCNLPMSSEKITKVLAEDKLQETLRRKRLAEKC